MFASASYRLHGLHVGSVCFSGSSVPRNCNRIRRRTRTCRTRRRGALPPAGSRPTLSCPRDSAGVCIRSLPQGRAPASNSPERLPRSKHRALPSSRVQRANGSFAFVGGRDEPTVFERGIRGLAIRIARAVNRAWLRRGRVWGDRYHAHSLRSPREVRNALVYVLQNFRKHFAQWSGWMCTRPRAGSMAGPCRCRRLRRRSSPRARGSVAWAGDYMGCFARMSRSEPAVSAGGAAA